MRQLSRRQAKQHARRPATFPTATRDATQGCSTPLPEVGVVNAATRCEVCGQPADRQDLLPCSMCGRWFHFPRQGRPARDCGVVIPNPYSEQGC